VHDMTEQPSPLASASGPITTHLVQVSGQSVRIAGLLHTDATTASTVDQQQYTKVCWVMYI